MTNYNNLKNFSNKIITHFNDIIINNNLKGNYNIYKCSFPHYANFNKEDKVISIMGINPSVPIKSRLKNEYYNMWKNKDLEKYFKEEKYLDLYYIPLLDYIEKNIDNLDSYINIKTFKEYFSKNICNFANKPYKFINNNILNSSPIINKYFKMPWQKYDINILDIDSYEKNKFINLNQIYSSLDLNDKFVNTYLNFINLLYVSYKDEFTILNIIRNDSINNINLSKLISDFFKMQLDYYNSKLTIIANAGASHYFEDIISKIDKNWKKNSLSPNLYKYYNEEKYIYLTSRFFDRMDDFSKKLLIQDLKNITTYLNLF